MMILVYFGDRGAAFRFVGGGAALTSGFIARALAAQHVPELVCDGVATQMEVQAELPVLEYFRSQRRWRVQAPKAWMSCFIVFLLLFTMRAYNVL